MTIESIGFIGLGNLGSQLSGSLQAHGHDLIVRDLDRERVRPLLDAGALWADSPEDLARRSDLVITCLPSPAICAEVMEGDGGVISGLGPGTVWIEMSTTDAAEVRRLAGLVEAGGADALDCPVSGGCHRAASGNISILVGGHRPVFERVLPVLGTMGRRILHTGAVGTASELKVMTNYLATANLVSVAEALVTARALGLDLNVTYEAIAISSGTSFVHETEGQLILNGSRDIGFTMDLVAKDIGLFQSLADDHGVPLEISPLLNRIFADGIARYGPQELSPNIIRRLEDATGLNVLAAGFPPGMIDHEPPGPGVEVTPTGWNADAG